MNWKQILKHSIIFISIISALLLIYEPMSLKLTKAYSNISNSLYPHFISNKNIIVQAKPEIDEKSDQYQVRVQVGNMKERNQQGRILSRVFRIPVRTFVYFPMILLFSLIISSPVPWKRRFISMLLSITSLQLFIFIKMIAYLFQSSPDMFKIAELGGFLQSLVDIFCNIFIINTETGSSIAVVFILFLIFTFRISDLEELKKKFLT